MSDKNIIPNNNKSKRKITKFIRRKSSNDSLENGTPSPTEDNVNEVDNPNTNTDSMPHPSRIHPMTIGDSDEIDDTDFDSIDLNDDDGDANHEKINGDLHQKVDTFKRQSAHRVSRVRQNEADIKPKTSHIRKQESALNLVEVGKKISLVETLGGVRRRDTQEPIKDLVDKGSDTAEPKKKVSFNKYKPTVPTYLMNDIMSTNPQELDEDTELHVKKKNVTCMLLCTVSAIALSSLQYGWAIGVVNAPQKIVTNWYNETNIQRRGVGISYSHMTILWAITVAIYNVSGFFGGLMAGYYCDRFGRKKTLLINNAITFVGSILFLTSKVASSYEMVILGRLFIGYNCGVSSSSVAIYLSEIAPVNLRGAVCSAHQVFLSLGIVLSQIIGLPHVLGTESGWPILFSLAIVPAIIQLVVLPMMPESPRYLLIYKGREQRARKALQRLRNSDDVEDEIQQMKVEYEDQKRLPKVTWSDMIRKGVYRKPLIISSETHVSQQLSAISAVLSYSTSLFLKANLSDDNAKYATIGMGVLYFLLCGLSSLVVERAGRRTLYLTGLGGMWFSSILLTIMLVQSNRGKTWASYLSILFVFTYVGFCAIGPSVIAWFIASELFTQAARPKGASLAVCFNWGSSFIAVLLFPILLATIGDYTFLVLMVLLTLFWFYTYFFLPETQGRTSDELSRLFMSNEEKSAIYKFWKNYRFRQAKRRHHPHRHQHNYDTRM